MAFSGSKDSLLPFDSSPRIDRGSLVGALIVLVAAAAVAAGSPGEAVAQSDPEPASLVVFMLEGPEKSANVREELTSVIREEARQRSGYELVNDNPMVLSDTAVVLGCNSVSTTCLGKAADHFDADYLVFGKIEDVSGRSRVSVRLYDASKGQYVESFGRVLTKLSEPYDPFRKEVGKLLDSQTGAGTTVLKVRSNVDGATVQIDGSVAGETPFEKEGLEPGRHEVRIEAEAYEPWDREVELDPSGTVELRATLNRRESGESSGTSGARAKTGSTPSSNSGPSSSVPPGEPGEDKTTGAVAKWGPWIAIGTGALALAGSGVAGGEVIRANNDLNKWRTENDDNTERCETEEECDIIERGENAQTTHRILLGVGGVTVASGALWLVFQNVGSDQKQANAALRRLQISATDRSVSVGWRW